MISSECKVEQADFLICCSYYVTSWRKSALIPKNLLQIPEAFQQRGMAEMTE